MHSLATIRRDAILIVLLALRRIRFIALPRAEILRETFTLSDILCSLLSYTLYYYQSSLSSTYL